MKSLIRRLFWRPKLTAPAEPAVDRYALCSGERQIGRTLAEVRFDHVARYQLAARLIEEHSADHEPAFGLDVFCGTGYGTRLVAERVKCPILGIDASNDAIGVANANYASTRTLFSAKIFPFSLPVGSFDFIVCLESIEHVETADAFLDIMVEALKPGGLLILSTPNSERWSLELNPNPFHYRHYSRTDLLTLAEAENKLQLISSFSQNLYQFEAGRIVTPLAADAMGIRDDDDGQILLFLFRRLA